MARNFPKGGKGRSLSRSAISRIMDASDSSVPGGSFSDLVKADKQMQVKYDRPADLEKFVNRSRKFQEGIDLGGRVEDGVLQMIGVDGTIRDPQGRQILSMSKPGITPVKPNFREALGDIKRAFTGYNTLSYDPTSSGTPTTTGGFIERQPGILANLNPLSFIPGANALVGGVKAIKDIFFPDPPIVRTGGSVTGSVTEEPLSSGVIDVLPDNFIPVLKTKPDLPIGDQLRSMDLMYDFYNLPFDKPELYG